MFLKLINSIKINIINNKKILILKNLNKKNNNLIKLLIKYNVIKYLIKKNNNTILILNNFNKKNTLKLKNMYKPSNYKILKLKNLKKMKKNNAIILLSTNKGVVDNYQAIKKKTGGIIITYIWN